MDVLLLKLHLLKKLFFFHLIVSAPVSKKQLSVFMLLLFCLNPNTYCSLYVEGGAFLLLIASWVTALKVVSEVPFVL